MREMIWWLTDVEHLAARVYRQAAKNFRGGDPELAGFVERLADEEEGHGELIREASKFTGDVVLPVPPLTIPPERMKEIEGYFILAEKRIHAGELTGDGLIECMVATEFSEWNELFVFVISTLGRTHGRFKAAALDIQGHKRRIEEFLSSRPGCGRHLEEVRKLAPVWVESFLVVDDEELICDAVEAILEGEGTVDRASDGARALELVEKNYYAVVISDVDMPVMDGMEFYRRATELFPGLKGRFIFFTGAGGAERTEFFESEGVEYLVKPADISALKGAVARVLKGV